MPNILIREVPKKTVDKLKLMAKRHNRSLQQELKEILENVPEYPSYNISLKASEIRKKLMEKRLRFSDSAELLREDRCR